MKSSTSNLPKRTLKDYFSFKMTPNNAVRWEHTRKKGMKRFVMLWGLLFGGLLSAHAIIQEIHDGTNITVSLIAYILLLRVVIGIIMGLIVWMITEKQYQNIEKNDQV